jgi:hypothetical protein
MSLWRVAGVRPEVAVRKCATAITLDRTAGLLGAETLAKLITERRRN